MSRRVIMVGAGVIGLSCAYQALRRGFQVTVLERGRPEDEGCSYGNAGMVVPSHFVPLAAPGMVALGLRWMWNPESPFYIQPRLDPELLSWGWKFYRAATAERVRQAAPLLRDLHLASRECFEEWARVSGNAFGLVTRGLLMLCKTAHALEEESRMAAQARALGVPAEVLDAKETAALDPAVRMDVAGSVYFPKDCHLTPGKLLGWLRAQVEREGGRIEWEREVIGWSREGSRIHAVQTSRGEIEADEVVLCGGSWSPGVARELRLNIPIQAGKGYSLTLAKPRQLPSICAIFTEARVAVTPMEGRLRVGGTMELGGLNDRVNPARVQGIIKSVPQYYPEFRAEDFQGVPVWHGLRPCAPDGLPYIGRSRRWENLVVATGHAMMGVSLAPVTGVLVSEILQGAKPSIPLDLVSPDRFV